MTVLDLIAIAVILAMIFAVGLTIGCMITEAGRRSDRKWRKR